LNVLFCSFSPWGDLLCLAARLLFLGGSVEAAAGFKPAAASTLPPGERRRREENHKTPF